MQQLLTAALRRVLVDLELATESKSRERRISRMRPSRPNDVVCLIAKAVDPASSCLWGNAATQPGSGRMGGGTRVRAGTLAGDHPGVGGGG